LTLKGLDIKPIAKAQDVFEQVGGDFGNHTGCQAYDRFCQKPLHVTSGILKLIEDTFNAFPNAVSPVYLFRE
jgi:hypothetical protein